MDLQSKIVGLALAALIALVGWNLKETWSLKESVFKLQQGQVILSQQMKKNTNFIIKQVKKLTIKKNKPNKKKKKKKSNVQ